MRIRVGDRLVAIYIVAFVTFCIVSTSSKLSALNATEFTFHHEHVLGTSMRITVEAADETQAAAVEQTALREIDRLESIFSRYRSDSQFMRWQAGELTEAQLAPELLRVLERAEQWRVDSRGAFDARALALSNLWKQAAASGGNPSAEELEHVVTQLRTAPYDAAGQQVGQRLGSRLDNCAMSLDAIAKGFILDEVAERIVSQYPQTGSCSIMIGGDMRTIGNREWELAIAHPLDAGENSRPIAHFQLRGSQGMATSGGYRRSIEVGGKKVSHIFDPRTGLAAESLLSATVVAPTAMDADAAATALSVLGPVDGLEMIESKPELACLIVLNSGDVVRSKRWNAFTNFKDSATASRQPPASIRMVSWADEKPTNGLHVKFTLARGEGGRYRRPYVAVWLEDKDGFPVKTAVLWLQTDGPGPRWHRDLTRWWADDRMRKLVEEKELIGTVSGATRGPGEYEARFDMTDNLGKSLPPGKYTLCLEAAREHGTHHLIREEIELATKPLAKKELKGGTEFSAAAYTYQPVTGKSSSPTR